MGVSLIVHICVWDSSFCLRSYVYKVLIMWLTGPKWDGDPLTPPLSRLGPLALWNVIRHPLGLLPPTLYPTATATLTAAAMSQRTGRDKDMGMAPRTHTALTGPTVRASSRDTSTMRYYRQVRTENVTNWKTNVRKLLTHLTSPPFKTTPKQRRPIQLTEACIHRCTSCGAIVNHQLHGGKKEKCWRPTRHYFPLSTVQLPLPPLVCITPDREAFDIKAYVRVFVLCVLFCSPVCRRGVLSSGCALVYLRGYVLR